MVDIREDIELCIYRTVKTARTDEVIKYAGHMTTTLETYATSDMYIVQPGSVATHSDIITI